jgi:hypothetical protein
VTWLQIIGKPEFTYIPGKDGPGLVVAFLAELTPGQAMDGLANS